MAKIKAEEGPDLLTDIKVMKNEIAWQFCRLFFQRFCNFTLRALFTKKTVSFAN